MHEIWNALGVSSEPVKRVLKNSSEGYRPLDRKDVLKWRPEDYDAILDRLREQKRTVSDVCEDPDMPSLGSYSVYARKHPEFVKKLKQTYYSLPYSMQIRTRFISPQIEIECQRMRARGMNMNKIAAILGISRYTVSKIFLKK